MAKTVKFEYKDKSYTLEFTRNSIKQMEAKGFRIGDLKEMPVTTIPEFFAGAFLANHRWVKRELIDEIFESIEKKDDLIGALGEMYSDTLTSLLGDEGEESGNIAWKVE
jgi:hypothetical protein